MYRRKHDLCFDCQQLLKNALENQNAKRNPKDTVTVAVPKCDHWLKYIQHPGTETDPRSSLHRLALCVGEPLASFGQQKITNLYERDCSTSSCIPVRMNKDALTALREVIAMVEHCIDSAYETGKSDGSNLLKSLASGNVTVKEFNRQSIKQGDDDD